MKLSKSLSLWILLTAIVSFSVFFFSPVALIGDIKEIPSDFLVGLLTFDGIMIAVVSFSVSSASAEGGNEKRWLTSLMSFPFLVSSVFTLYSLLRLHIGMFGETAAYVGLASSDAIEFTSFGLALWFFLMLGYQFVFAEELKTAPTGTPKTDGKVNGTEQAQH